MLAAPSFTPESQFFKNLLDAFHSYRCSLGPNVATSSMGRHVRSTTTQKGFPTLTDEQGKKLPSPPPPLPRSPFSSKRSGKERENKKNMLMEHRQTTHTHTHKKYTREHTHTERDRDREQLLSTALRPHPQTRPRHKTQRGSPFDPLMHARGLLLPLPQIAPTFVRCYLVPSGDSPSAINVSAKGMIRRPTASCSAARLRLG